jgi:hypothetical protein
MSAFRVEQSGIPRKKTKNLDGFWVINDVRGHFSTFSDKTSHFPENCFQICLTLRSTSNSVNNYPATCSRVLLEKLIVTQLVEKFPGL